MVKFEVRTGRAFDGKVTVVVETTTPERKSAPFRKWWIVAAIVAVLLTLIVAVLYGAATGDFAILKTIAESARDVFVEVAAKFAKKL
jgi:hypothetical protein